MLPVYYRTSKFYDVLRFFLGSDLSARSLPNGSLVTLLELATTIHLIVCLTYAWRCSGKNLSDLPRTQVEDCGPFKL